MKAILIIALLAVSLCNEPVDVVKCFLNSDVIFKGLSELIEAIQSGNINEMIAVVIRLYGPFYEEIKKCLALSYTENLMFKPILVSEKSSESHSSEISSSSEKPISSSSEKSSSSSPISSSSEGSSSSKIHPPHPKIPRIIRQIANLIGMHIIRIYLEQGCEKVKEKCLEKLGDKNKLCKELRCEKKY